MIEKYYDEHGILVLPLKNYIQDRILNIIKVRDDTVSLRKSTGKYIYLEGISNDYITTVAGLHNSPMWAHRHNGIRIDEWYIIPILYWKDEEQNYKTVVSVWHVHQKSELICSILRTDKNEWWCNVCCEPVPASILFMARTDGLRRAK